MGKGKKKSDNSKMRKGNNYVAKKQGGGKFKKQKKIEKFWIESCTEKTPNNPSVLKHAIRVIVTRVELQDNHHPANISTTATLSLGVISKLTATVSQVHCDANTKIMSCGNQISLLPTTTTATAAENSADMADKDTASIDSDHDDLSVINHENEENGATTNTTATAKNAGSMRPEPFISIHIDPSAQKKAKWMNYQQPYKLLPNGDCGDGIVNPYSSTIIQDKYWAQRKRLFTKFDQGIQLDAESWYSVTPEVIANHTAQRLGTSLLLQRRKFSYYPSEQQHFVVLDAFCGCGGNSIAFALQPEISQVVCVDIDPTKLQMLATNASIYGVHPSKLLLILADSVKIMKDYYKHGKLIQGSTNDDNSSDDNNLLLKRKQMEEGGNMSFPEGYIVHGIECLPPSIDAIYLSPPWGGPQYITENNRKSLNVEDLIHDKGGVKLLQLASSATEDGRNIIYFLPKNINGISMGKAVATLPKSLRKKSDVVELEQNYVNGKLKTVTAYVGMASSPSPKVINLKNDE